MAYKNYRLSLLLHLLAMVFDVVAITMLIIYKPDILYLSIATVIFVIILTRLAKIVMFPIEQMKMFLLSLRSKDYMIRMPYTNDNSLMGMYDDMNQIIARNRENEQLVETKKLYYDRMLRIMTHEIRNTVTPIITLSQHYIENYEKYSDNDIKEGISIINSQSKDIKKFLDSYRELTHIPPPQYQKIFIPELFSEIQKMFSDKPQNVTLSIRCPKIHIYADLSLIRIVICNLLKNGIESAKEYEDGSVELFATICEKQPQIVVTDNGAGIPFNRTEYIFLPFYTTKKNGNGIGLCLSRQIMRLHSGDLLVESNPAQRQTIFTMNFASNA